MIFEDRAPHLALGCVLAHSVPLAAGRLRKGTVISEADIDALSQAGIGAVSVAVLGDLDVPEDRAATALADAILPENGRGLRKSVASTGRVNLIATGAGVAMLDVAAIEAVNLVHPMITIATVPPHHQMSQGGLVATIKIISYGVPVDALARACAAATGAITLAEPVIATADLIVTTSPNGAGLKGVDAIESRLAALGVSLNNTYQIPHDCGALSEALSLVQSDMALILTASATSDIDDVAPRALRQAGGQVTRFGMPVDPGNLLFLGVLNERIVIGLPGCARSVALNGADWVMSRVICGINVTGQDIALMGVGGLLKEIPTRPHPRRSRE